MKREDSWKCDSTAEPAAGFLRRVVIPVLVATNATLTIFVAIQTNAGVMRVEFLPLEAF